MQYKHRVVIDSHDPRGIDVAFLSRYPLTSIRTNRHERNAANTVFLFSRECLEVHIDIDGKELTIFVNHFKSMLGGRNTTKAKRVEQTQRVAEIITER